MKRINAALVSALLIYFVLGNASQSFSQDAVGTAALVNGKITGYCFNDANGNGVKDTGEPGIAGIPVSLKRLFLFFIPQDAGTAQTDADGRYEFSGLKRGLYSLEIKNTSDAECKTKNPALTYIGFFKSTGAMDFGFAVTAAPLPKVSISADPKVIDKGGSSTLTWSSQDADSVSIDQGIGAVALQGSVKVTPEKTTTYSITAKGKGGTAQASVTITVTTPQVSTTTSVQSSTTTTIVSTTTTATSGGGGGGGGGGNTTTVQPSTTTSAQPTTSVVSSSSTSTVPAANTNVPNVIGKLQAEAAAAITAAGFSVGAIIQQYSASVEKDHVGSQFPYPLPGAVAAAGSAINLVVSLGTSGSPPPDPATNAPSLDSTIATSAISATSFLYEGQNPVQPGVAPGTIVPKQVAVLRGTVQTRDGDVLAALEGVTITILNHPEYGQTLSRSDGMFDLAVNGGGTMTINYQMEAIFLPSDK